MADFGRHPAGRQTGSVRNNRTRWFGGTAATRQPVLVAFRSRFVGGLRVCCPSMKAEGKQAELVGICLIRVSLTWVLLGVTGLCDGCHHCFGPRELRAGRGKMVVGQPNDGPPVYQ